MLHFQWQLPYYTYVSMKRIINLMCIVMYDSFHRVYDFLHSSVLQCVAVCCSVLQRVAVCCSVLQCTTFCIPYVGCHHTSSNSFHDFHGSVCTFSTSVFSLSLAHSLFFSVSLCLSLSLCLSVCLSLSPSLSLSLSLSFSLIYALPHIAIQILPHDPIDDSLLSPAIANA